MQWYDWKFWRFAVGFLSEGVQWKLCHGDATVSGINGTGEVWKRMAVLAGREVWWRT